MGGVMDQDQLFALASTTSTDDLKAECLRFTANLGFERFTAMTVIVRPHAPVEFAHTHNAPLAYHSLYFDAKRGAVDPVHQHCKRSPIPLAWSQRNYTRIGIGPQWEEQAPHGYRCGIALCTYLPQYRRFAFGVVRSEPLPSDPEELQRLVADVTLFAVLAQEGAFRVLMPRQDTHNFVLTPMELECLKWTAAGKTAWEVGRIVARSERAVGDYLHSAMRKLNCSNKFHLVAKAVSLGCLNV